jgi:hypothetical protein
MRTPIRRATAVLAILAAIGSTLAPGALGRPAGSCKSQEAHMKAITVIVNKLQLKVWHDGSGAATPKVFAGDLARLMHAKAQQLAAEQALARCHH